MDLAEQGFGAYDDASSDEEDGLSSSNVDYNVPIVKMAEKLVKEAQLARIDMPPQIKFLLQVESLLVYSAY